jgi:hypothetical protein
VPDDVADACAFAYECLRQPGCSEPTPAAMRSFVHHPRLSARALTVAHEALETNLALRHYVARRATPATVGEAGVTWLQEAHLRLDEIDRLHRRIAELEAALAERTEQWRTALRDLSGRQG